jgi:hypothetical protein
MGVEGLETFGCADLDHGTPSTLQSALEKARQYALERVALEVIKKNLCRRLGHPLSSAHKPAGRPADMLLHPRISRHWTRRQRMQGLPRQWNALRWSVMAPR